MPEQPGETLYAVLGVAPTATTEEITAAYRRLRRTTHPDVGGTDGLFRLIQHAFEVLSDPAARAAYDRDGPPAPADTNTGHATRHDEDPVDDWGTAADWDTPNTNEDTRTHEKPQGEAAYLSPMHRPPPPRPPIHTAVAYDPPLQPPPWDAAPSKPRWRKLWLAIVGPVATLMIGALAFLNVLDMRWNPFGPPDPVRPLEILANLLPVAIVLLLIAIGPPLLHRHLHRPQRPSRPLLATDVLPIDVLNQRSHGIPGVNLSAGRFGAVNATLGRAGEERTDHLLQESLLPTYPAMRMIHGLRWPGTDHGDIDHALLLGHTIILIDSKMWRDGHYWWDGKQLWLEGEPRPDVTFGETLRALRAELPPPVQLYGVVLVHSTTGAANSPTVENGHPSQSPYGGHIVSIFNPRDALACIHQIAQSVPDGHVLDVRLLRRLLEQRHSPARNPAAG